MYLEEVRRRGDLAQQLYFTWAQGFISATNALLNTGVTPATTLTPPGFSPEQQQAELSRLCSVSRDEDFSKAAVELLDQIRVRQGLPKLLD
jgi:uncharacterized protein YkwD